MNYRRLCLLIGLVLSFGKINSQQATEIYLFDLEIKDGQVTLSNGKNITKHKGYDNQPFFHPGKPLVYYASFNDSGRSDIKCFNFETSETRNITNTREREYSPTVTPDGEFISCILQRDNGAQDLVKYPIDGGRPQVLVWHLKVGYHAWADENRVLLFVLDDSVHNSLHNYYLDTNTDTVVAENIGRSLHHIPGQDAMSFVQKIPGKPFVIKRFDLGSGLVSTINTGVDGQDYMTWLNGGIMLMSDGKSIFSCSDKHDAQWQPVKIIGDTKMLKGISRLSVNTGNSKVAVVVNE
jgi:hypothetical protein